MIVQSVSTIAFALVFGFVAMVLHQYSNYNRTKPWVIATIVFGLLLIALGVVNGIGLMREG